jgi:hypothetical protein
MYQNTYQQKRTNAKKNGAESAIPFNFSANDTGIERVTVRALPTSNRSASFTQKRAQATGDSPRKLK